MKTRVEDNIDISEYVINYFKVNKLQRTIFKSDEKQAAKLNGIQAAVNNGLLTAKKHPLNDDYIIRATNKLIKSYSL